MLTYWTEDDTELLAEWYAGLAEDVQAKVDFYLKYLEVTEDWFTPGDALQMKGKYKALTKIRFDIEREEATWRRGFRTAKDRYRLIGFISRYPTRGAGGTLEPGWFVIFLGCQKWRGRTDPPGAYDWALRLKRDLEQGTGVVDDYSL